MNTHEVIGYAVGFFFCCVGASILALSLAYAHTVWKGRDE